MENIHKECPQCQGKGTYISEDSCCGAEIEHGICVECREHCENEEETCNGCNGLGKVDEDIEKI